MLERIRLLGRIMTSKFVTGYVGDSEGNGTGFTLGESNGLEAIVASMSIQQQVHRIKKNYLEKMIDSGLVRESVELNRDWSKWLAKASKDSDVDIFEVIDTEKLMNKVKKNG